MKRLKNPRKVPKWEVEIFSENLKVSFLFSNKNDANEFFDSALKSKSVSGASLFHDEKFMGARDGNAS
jgi:hypothetical protein